MQYKRPTGEFVSVDDLSIQAWQTLTNSVSPTAIFGGIETYIFPPFLNNRNNRQGYLIFGMRAKPCPEILNNSALIGFTLGSTYFPSVEHFYQASKFHPHRPDIVGAIMSEPNPSKVIEMGGNAAEFVAPDWAERRLAVMQRGVDEKFRQNAHISCALNDESATAHGATDSYWGTALAGQASGQNHLGRILNETRQKLESSGAPCGVLVKIKLSSSSTHVSGDMPPPSAQDNGSNDELSELQKALKTIIGRILTKICQATQHRCVAVKPIAAGTSYTYSLATAGRDHFDMVCAQCALDKIVGLAGRSVLSQLLIDGMSIVRGCIRRDKMKIYDPDGARSHDALFAVKESDELDISAARPMLAESGQTVEKTIKMLESKGSPNIYVQPKLDGVRMVAFFREGELVMMTRTGRLHPIVDRFKDEIAPIITQIQERTGLQNVALDGEIYVHGVPSGLIDWVSGVSEEEHPYTGYIVPGQLNKITGALSSYGGKVTTGKKSSACVRNAPLIEILEYHVFTWFELGGTSSAIRRYELLASILPIDKLGSNHFVRQQNTWKHVGPKIYTVPHKSIKYDELSAVLELVARTNYEGIMVYQSDAPYGSDKRDARLIKIKFTETEWFPVVGVAPEKNGAPSANILYAYGEGTYVASGFFNEAMKSFLFHNADRVVGLWAYIRFQKITQGAAGGGALRDPKVIYLSTMKEGKPLEIGHLL